ncbi:hypothetical protein ACOMHN_046126 [Nucella lapillus]
MRTISSQNSQARTDVLSQPIPQTGCPMGKADVHPILQIVCSVDLLKMELKHWQPAVSLQQPHRCTRLHSATRLSAVAVPLTARPLRHCRQQQQQWRQQQQQQWRQQQQQHRSIQHDNAGKVATNFDGKRGVRSLA